MRNWLRSSNTLFLCLAMKLSNLSVKVAICWRRSSKPKLIFGNDSAMEGTLAVDNGARIVELESEASNIVDILTVSSCLVFVWYGTRCFLRM